VRISDSEIVQALVPIYEGKSLVRARNTDELADMVCRAVGSTGRCIDYVKDIAGKLAELDIDDPAVTELVSVVERKKPGNEDP
jgi:cation transport regulator ChaC